MHPVTNRLSIQIQTQNNIISSEANKTPWLLVLVIKFSTICYCLAILFLWFPKKVGRNNRVMNLSKLLPQNVGHQLKGVKWVNKIDKKSKKNCSQIYFRSRRNFLEKTMQWAYESLIV